MLGTLFRRARDGDRVRARTAEQALRESEQRFALVAAGSSDGIWDWDFARDRHYISPPLKAMLGYADEELPSRHEAFRQCIHPDDLDRVDDAVQRHFHEGREYEEEYRLRRKDGRHIWVRSRGAAVRAADGTVTRFCGSVSEIGAQHEAAERVNALLDEQRAMLDNLVAGIARLKDRRVVTCNRRFAEMYGYSVAELIGQPVALLHGDEARDKAGEAVYADLARDGKVAREYLHRRRDGSLIWVHSSGTALDRDDPRRDSLWVNVDISEQKRAEQALRDNEARFYHAVRGSRDAIWDWDLANGRYYMSPRMREILGYGYGEPISERAWFLERLHPDDRERVEAARVAHFESGAPYEAEYRMRAADGSLRWIRARGQCVRDAAGRVLRFSGANSDVTLEREATERIRALVAEQRAVLDNTVVGIARIQNHVIVSCNARLSEMFGHGSGDLAGRSISMLYGSDEEFGAGVLNYAKLRGGRHWRSEREFVRSDGSAFWCATYGRALDQEEPRNDSIWIFLDIDSRKRSEIALQSEKEFSEALLAAQPGVFCVLAKTQRLVRWNRNLETVTGYDATALARIGGREIIAPDHRDRLGEAVYRVFKHGAASVEADLLTRDGTRIPQLWTAVRWEAAGETYAVVSAIDISERLGAEEEIRALNQRLEQRVAERTAELTRANLELESFSYTVSHDLSAPLRAINGFSALLVEELGGRLEPPAQRLLERISAGSMQMKALIDDLLRLAQISRTRLVASEVDLATLARHVAAECARDPAREISARGVVFRVPASLPARGDPGLLGIALTNLIGNAWKFTARSQPALVEFGALERDGERVYFLRDNGAGFDMRYAGKLFKPFQRLHSAREFDGTGIGLAIVHRIVERHRGRIWVESAPGAGTTFYFTLGTTTMASGAHLTTH